MGALRIVVANEPRAYREVLARALQIQRPTLDVILVDPQELAVTLTSAMPDLLIATEIASESGIAARTRLLLYPGGQNLGVVATACGSRRTIEEITLEDILSLIDGLHAPGPGSLDSGQATL